MPLDPNPSKWGFLSGHTCWKRMFHKAFPVHLNRVTASIARIRLIHHQTRHLFCSLLWRKKDLVACSESRKYYKENTPTSSNRTISPTPTLCNNCLWKSPCIYQLVVYLFLQDSEIYFLGQYFFKEKVRQKPNFLNISMKTIRFQDVCYNTCYSFLCETINIISPLPFL